MTLFRLNQALDFPAFYDALLQGKQVTLAMDPCRSDTDHVFVATTLENLGRGFEAWKQVRVLIEHGNLAAHEARAAWEVLVEDEE